MMLLRVEDETDEALVDLKRKCEGLPADHTALKARLDQSTATG
jgi:prefoldin subunit 5